MNQSLYERIGGEAAVNAAVDIFYRKVLADKRISRFFETVDMERQAAKQKAFLTYAFGGPVHYSGKDMRQGHAHLVTQGLHDSHFDAVMENLGATQHELNVPPACGCGLPAPRRLPIAPANSSTSGTTAGCEVIRWRAFRTKSLFWSCTYRE